MRRAVLSRWAGAGGRLRAWAAALAAAATSGCPAWNRTPPDAGACAPFSVVNGALDSVDLLFVVDNSSSMRDPQARLAQQFGVLIGGLVDPPRDEMGRPRHPAVRSLRVGVVSSDLGTPGATVPSCTEGDVGDDGLLNPIRRGRAMSTHPPWRTAPVGTRPARCTTDPNQYPVFLAFEADATRVEDLREDIVCNAYLSTGGCGLEQPLEAAYRALVTHDARARAGNTRPNAGFLRDNAVLAVVVVTDEEDGSVRDCRYAEPGGPCDDALSVFEGTSPRWASSDLNLRFYMYRPGSEQDPTWPLDRYIAVTDGRLDTTRGFVSLKPGRPDRVVFAAITGVPIQLPTRAGTGDVDWERLLGREPDGADAYAEMSPEGPVSMRPANTDQQCPNRVVPGCRLQGSAYDPARPACEPLAQHFGWPARRIAEVARRFAVYNGGNGAISSICRTDYADALSVVVARLRQGLRQGFVLSRELPTDPPAPQPGEPIRVPCTVREELPAEVTPEAWCTPARGRVRVGGERAVCRVLQVEVPLGSAPAPGYHGFYYDLRPGPDGARRPQIGFTTGDEPHAGARVTIACDCGTR